MKAGEVLGATVQRAVPCAEVARQLLRLESLLDAESVKVLREAILVGRSECRKEVGP